MGTRPVAVVVAEHRDLHPWDLYEIGIAAAVFGAPRPDIADTWYDLWWSAPEPPVGPPPGDMGVGIRLHPTRSLREIVDAHTVIVTAVPEACVDGARDLPDALLDALRDAAAAGARMVSLCTGAFALAAAGLLDGRRATAHWGHTAILARRYPAVDVDDSVLYIDDGTVLTSAGMTAGLDLCLHLVRTDLGTHVANHLARDLVVPAHRPGGQAQFVDRSMPTTDDDALAPVLQWATTHLDEPLTVRDLACHAGLGSRTFFRRMKAATGSTPLRWLLHQRLTHARALLEASDLPVDVIAQQCGLGTAANLRRHFTRQVGVAPSQYRRAFAAPGRTGLGQ